MNAVKKILFASLFIFPLGVPVLALDPNQPASSFLRTHFTIDNGLPAAVVDQSVQTKDGFLWLIVNGNNLIRFDGKNFYRFNSPRATTLAVAPDGDLWAGTHEGLVRIPSSSFNQFTLSGLVTHHPGPGKASDIICLRFTSNGVLWVGTEDGLFRYEQDQFVTVGPRAGTHDIEELTDGHLSVITRQGLMEFDGSSLIPQPRPAAQLGLKDGDIFDVLRDSRGNTWYCTTKGVALATNGPVERLGTWGGAGQAALRAHEDAQGTVWIGKEKGLFRATPAGLEPVDEKIPVRSLYSDRDNNLWVSTNGDGLYKFKEPAVRMFTTEHGMPNNVIRTAIAAHDGTIWAGTNCGGLVHFEGTNFRIYNEQDGLRNTCIIALAEDLNRSLWIATYGGVFLYHNGNFTEYTKSSGLPDNRVRTIVVARDGSVWFGTPTGAIRLKDGQFRTFTTDDGLSANSIAKIFEDRSGNIWVGSRLGLDRLVGDRFENFAALPKALVIPFGEDRDGGFFFQLEVDGEAVTHRLHKDRSDIIKQLTGADMLETEGGELWFSGDGIGRIQPGNFAQARPRDEPLDYEGFSMADGLATAEATGLGRCLALTREGKLFVATPKGLAMFDLRRLSITNTKPMIYLTDVTIGRNSQRADREIVLPPGTSHVEIHFAAVEVAAPEKIRMQYRLDGVDSEWLDAPANPNAIYSRIPVGTHALRIRACNRNGIWDRQGVVFMVTQQPYFYQTRWFRAAVITLGLLLVVLVYRVRVAQISRQMSARFDERLAERTRVARELHDTLLQTVQGSKMVADHALKDSADHTRMVRAMEQLATWLAQATEEGRAALLSLRASTTDKNDLADAFRRAIDECGKGGGAETSFSVNGESRDVHPVVRDEIYRIGYEAIRNACAHSSGGQLEVTLEYAHDLTLRVSDDGTGIEKEVVEKGKEGHFGLRGMRERAERIGAKFTLVSSPETGTVITLVVPGRIAFNTGTA